MNNSKYSSVDSINGNVTWDGPLSIEKGNHSGMPSRTGAYLPGDERGHVNASSLGGTNNPENITPQHRDLNHGAYLSVENGERSALQNGASIDSVKTAVVNSHPGDRPSAFTVNDTVTYADGHSENIYHSFTNESYDAQAEWNDMASLIPGVYDTPNPGDALRESMEMEEYAELMEETDAVIPDLDVDYSPSDFSGDPYAASEMESDVSVDSANDGSVDNDGEDVDDGIDI